MQALYFELFFPAAVRSPVLMRAFSRLIFVRSASLFRFRAAVSSGLSAVWSPPWTCGSPLASAIPDVVETTRTKPIQLGFQARQTSQAAKFILFAYSSYYDLSLKGEKFNKSRMSLRLDLRTRAAYLGRVLRFKDRPVSKILFWWPLMDRDTLTRATVQATAAEPSRSP